MRPLLLALLLSGCGAPPTPTATHAEPVDLATEVDLTATLANMARQPEGTGRRPMLQALRRAPAEQALPALRAGLENPDPGIRAAAAIATGRRSDGHALAPELFALTRDPVPAVRIAAIRGLGGLRHTDAFLPLQQLLADPAADLRHAALRALVRIDPARAAALPELGRLQLDPDPRISGAATKVSRGIPLQ